MLSTLVFDVYTQELAVRMRKTGWGIKTRNEVLSILLYADDVVVMSEELQKMLDVVYGKNRDVNFSDEKKQGAVSEWRE